MSAIDRALAAMSKRVRPVVAWYDFWIGAYWDQEKRRLYVLPLPMIGFYVQFGDTDERD